ncbi:hypothetical protein ACFOY4_01115 [Actinomadura syzygii]|uniref:Uncharacterized protein n=1 Tax=Actinomadura syzygii TaxID=1427538 RepID=A0A5D0TS98_9ACTN|nr:hypothetical protein [Actinomadura syzygii]TYC08644.1 hypothetical protein FXF65_37800 [Actinomadura syzygii]
MNGTQHEDVMILTALARQLGQTRLRTQLIVSADPITLHVANGDYLNHAGQELLASDLHILRGGVVELLRWSAGDILGPADDLDAAFAKVCESLLIDDDALATDTSPRGAGGRVLRPAPPATLSLPQTVSAGADRTARGPSTGWGVPGRAVSRARRRAAPHTARPAAVSSVGAVQS